MQLKLNVFFKDKTHRFWKRSTKRNGNEYFVVNVRFLYDYFKRNFLSETSDEINFWKAKTIDHLQKKKWLGKKDFLLTKRLIFHLRTGFLSRRICWAGWFPQHWWGLADELQYVRGHQVLVLQDNYSYLWSTYCHLVRNLLCLSKFWLHLVHHALFARLRHWAAVPWEAV